MLGRLSFITRALKVKDDERTFTHQCQLRATQHQDVLLEGQVYITQGAQQTNRCERLIGQDDHSHERLGKFFLDGP